MNWFLVLIVVTLLWSIAVSTLELSNNVASIGGFLIGFFIVPNVCRRLDKLVK